jgi:hypothetical protein
MKMVGSRYAEVGEPVLRSVAVGCSNSRLHRRTHEIDRLPVSEGLRVAELLSSYQTWHGAQLPPVVRASLSSMARFSTI